MRKNTRLNTKSCLFFRGKKVAKENDIFINMIKNRELDAATKIHYL